jgi:hypothetical protein
MSPFPTHNQKPSFRQPTHNVDPTSFDRLPLRIRFDLLDFDHELWGWSHLLQEEYREFLKFIHKMEKMTWSEIKHAAGGRRHGTNHHPLQIDKFYPKAQERFKAQNLHRIAGDSLFSLRKNSTTRIYGHREGEYFRPIWYDRYHDDKNKAAYPLASH